MKEKVMEVVDTFRHLKTNFATNGRIDTEINYSGMEVSKCAGVLRSSMGEK